MVRKHVVQHSPWLAVAIVGGAINWLWWIDAAVRPAVTPYYDKTEILSSSPSPGDTVTIYATGRVNRVCPKEYRRSLVFPDGTSIELSPGHGTRFRPGDGGIYIQIDTDPHWPEGTYQFRSTGIHDCNPPFPPQIIPGISAEFSLKSSND